MDIEKLIEQLNGYFEGKELKRGTAFDAATALSTLQAENEKLRAELEHWRNAHHQAAINFQQENRECNKILAELERVKRERDAAIEDLHKLCPAWKWDGQKED